MSEIEKWLRDRAAERRIVGWEISDVMTPGEMEEAANEIARLRERINEAPLLLGQIVLAAGGEVRIPAEQMQDVRSVIVTRWDDKTTGDAVFTASIRRLESTADDRPHAARAPVRAGNRPS